MFQSARLRLTAWYLVIIMAVSIMFSIAFYGLATREIQRVIRLQEARAQRIQIITPDDQNIAFIRSPSIEDLNESRQRLALILLLINCGIFVFSGGAAYFLAGLTLTPIKEMVDEQNRFISDSSHELRTPLTSLRSEIEVALRNKKLTLPDARKFLESNLEETIALQTLSNNLLELAQNGDMIKPRDMSDFSLLEVLKTAIKRVEPQAKKKQIILKNEAQDATLHGAPDRITELFVILLDNAIKYSKARGKIEIISTNNNKTFGVSVIDHGPGIEENDLPHIFDRFFRADKSRSASPGYGLGLSIAKKIAEVHDGRIEAESVPGKQTIFRVVLPYKV